MTMWRSPTAMQELEILRSTSTVAIVGMSADPSRASHFVATYLLSSSCRFDEIWFVNPKGGEILGRPVYPSLADLPGVPDLVDVFRRASELPSVAREFVAIPGAKTFWAQLGLYSAEAVDIVTSAGRVAVMNRCLKIEHARFAGGLHCSGFDTGVVSSRRRPDL
ncbi:MAG TPA: CoA-binding protein [Ilumatobacteraceae bacterium]|nr:CoA-binding protein [Ilumatobacteraceae bacterium]